MSVALPPEPVSVAPVAGSPLAAVRTTADAGRPAPAVVLDAVSKRFAARRSWGQALRAPFDRRWATVLDRVSLEVQRGEFFGILGPNGAGKTTLFRVLSGMVLADSGRATIDGHDVSGDLAAVRRLAGIVMTSDRTLYWRLSARENLELYAALHGLRGAEAARRVAELLALVGLADAGRKLAGEFSSGMRQRLLIARALLPRPGLLLLDEPTRSLDPISARDFRRFLRDEVVVGAGCTVIMATHSSEEAMELCDRLAVLDRGSVLATGDAATLKQRYAEPRFAVWTRDDASAAIGSLVSRGLVDEPAGAPTPDGGWLRTTLRISGGLERASLVLDALHALGVTVARFERVDPDLAELIERIVRAPRPEAGA